MWVSNRCTHFAKKHVRKVNGIHESVPWSVEASGSVSYLSVLPRWLSDTLWHTLPLSITQWMVCLWLQFQTFFCSGHQSRLMDISCLWSPSAEAIWFTLKYMYCTGNWLITTTTKTYINIVGIILAVSCTFIFIRYYNKTKPEIVPESGGSWIGIAKRITEKKMQNACKITHTEHHSKAYAKGMKSDKKWPDRCKPATNGKTEMRQNDHKLMLNNKKRKMQYN